MEQSNPPALVRLTELLGPNAENVMPHPERWTFDWFYKRRDMDKADNRAYRQTETERRAAELHEGCRMPMEQARELAASEASPDWYSRGQDWGLADALTNGQSGDWVLDDIARAFSAGAQAADQSSRTAELVAVLARLCELNAAERPMAKVWNAAQALVDSYKGADTRKPCTCDGAGRGPGRACVVKAGGRLGDLWRCADGLGA